MKIVVTVPAYNEGKTIGLVLNGIHEVMQKEGYDYEILVLDDGSKDDTAKIARESKATVFSHPMNYGLAETFRTEIEKSLELGADIIVHFDADGQYLAEEIPLLITKLDEGNDLVLGSRFKGKIEEMPLMKRLGNKAFSKAISYITGLRVSDGQTGFRAFTKQVAKEIRITSGHTYTQEQIIRAVRQKFRIAEVPITFAKRMSGKSRLMRNPFDYAVKAWINIFRIFRDHEPLKFFGIIGLVFLAVGLAIGFWLLYLFITTGKIGHTPSAIMSILLILMGVQIVIFGFIADMNKK